MSLSDFFNKKTRAFIAGVAILFGGAGGYVGHEAVRAEVEPQRSTFTLQQAMNAEMPAQPAGSTLTEEEWAEQAATQVFKYGQLPAGTKIDPATQEARKTDHEAFTARIDKMEALKEKGQDVTQVAVQFVNDLRFAENLTENDYADIVKDYNKRVGVDVTPQTGNWQKGIAYQQEAQLEVIFDEIGNMFGGGDDEDLTEAQLSAKVGTLMEQQQKSEDLKTAGGALGGVLLGGLLLAPAWAAARRRHPVVAQGRRTSPVTGTPKP